MSRDRAATLAHWWQEQIPFNRRCHIRVASWDDDGVRMEVDATDELSNGVGSIHGGVVATLVDTAANAAAITVDDFAPGSLVATVSMTVHYVGPARGHLVATAACVRRGGTLRSVTVDVRDDTGTLVAHGVVVVKVSAAAAPAPR